jgi:hypothetical protein
MCKQCVNMYVNAKMIPVEIRNQQREDKGEQ